MAPIGPCTGVNDGFGVFAVFRAVTAQLPLLDRIGSLLHLSEKDCSIGKADIRKREKLKFTF